MLQRHTRNGCDFLNKDNRMAGSFGERLRREREMRGVSLENIAEATKIGTRLLRALEEEHFELLPGGIFNKGFVRAYAKYLGLNEEETVTDYLQAAGESGPDPRLIAEQNATRIDRSSDELGHSGASRFPLVPVLILLVVVAAGWASWRIYQERLSVRANRSEATAGGAQAPAVKPETQAPSSENPSNMAPPGSNQATQASSPNVSTQPSDSLTGLGGGQATDTTPEVKKSAAATGSSKPATDATILVGATKATDTTKPPAANAASAASTAEDAASGGEQAFEVSVRAKDRAWVSISSDGKITVRGIINPPDIKTVRATKQVVFRTGNAGAVEVSFNGQHIALGGGPNTEGTLVFNAHGVVIPTPAVTTRQP
jgi:cytoskeletal protein RodZ